MDQFLDYLFTFFQYGIFFYCTAVLFSYWLIAKVSAKVVMKYKQERDLTDYREILASPLVPSISIIAPAYNEGVTITDNIRSLLSLHYSKLTVIIVNDGSKDDTRDKAIANYDLIKVPFDYQEKIATKKVRGVYRSKNPAFKKLIFVDKENGGKADAINVGINVSNSEYFACIDVDCIIEPESFLKMVKPIMEAGEKRMIAVGGIVWLTNDSEIKNGRLIQVKTPESYIPKAQVLEYIRAFLLGRTAWSKTNGLLLISGAFGLFDREVAVAAGGYNHNTVGEDMELVMRMHGDMRERKQKYQVGYVPEPLCWTEAPADYNILGRQRNRWTRGTIECLTIHKKMFFNRKYGILGMLSYPYWLFAEWLAPFVELGGTLFFIIMAFLDMANWPYFFSLLAMVYFFAVMLSTYAIYTQERTYGRYSQVKDIFKLFWNAVSEPFKYHPRTVWWSIKGNWDYITGSNKGWGEMTRAGFQKKD